MTARRRPPLPSSVDASEIRSAIRTAAVGGGATRKQAEGLTLAAWEAVLNAIEHGAGPPVITIGVAAHRVTVLVAEPGSCWEGHLAGEGDANVPDPWAPRGRGWRIIHALTDEVHRFGCSAATYVELVIRLPG